MRSTPGLDEQLRLRLQEAVDQFDGGSADAFGRRIGYTNGGYIRESLGLTKRKKPVRTALIEKVHAAPGLAGWFDAILAARKVPAGSAEQEEAAWLDALRSIKDPAMRNRVIGYAQAFAEPSTADIAQAKAAASKPFPNPPLPSSTTAGDGSRAPATSPRDAQPIGNGKGEPQ